MRDSDESMLVKHHGGSYVMFLPTDLTSIKELRSALRNSLTENRFSAKDISQIELAADEALTNSISANVKVSSDETIICRWLIRDHKFTLWIMDYGSGLKTEKLEAMPADTKPSNLKDYISYIQKHQEKKCEILPCRGSQIPHRNIGKGLQIIQSLMDSFRIMYHCGEGKISTNPDAKNIKGSIIELGFDASKHPA
ncbi:ATP-binding protein [Leptospira ellisii]|uniref:ATP-binding protein n=2 Tax=Leptospira ellisii TaxID=2023197 RepID=A0A2N0B851_9LEPT|nr:ATP-binding protein [Leptospira ellisii]MDV6236073.1 ATP-binding protein [Leptospira ellisii]PJZ92689.1 anti-sigma regulatory factor [Leptospira ellisii]